MTDYTTVADVKRTQPAIGSVTTITSAVMANFIVDVERYINGMIAPRYTVPVADAPMLTTIATDLAIQRMIRQRAINFPGSNIDDMLARYEPAADMLKAIVAGSLQLVTSSGDLIATRSDTREIYSTTMGYNPTFHEGDQYDMVQDQDKLDDIESDRDL